MFAQISLRGSWWGRLALPLMISVEGPRLSLPLLADSTARLLAIEQMFVTVMGVRKDRLVGGLF